MEAHDDEAHPKAEVQDDESQPTAEAHDHTQPNATRLVREALHGTGIGLVASCEVGAYDARAPAAFRAGSWLPGARGVVVAGSAGPALWRAFRARTRESPEVWSAPHPYDAFVAEQLDRGDRALAAAGIRFRRFEAAFEAPVRIHFVALAELVGLGAPGPFALAIHSEHGAWWALRGAWLVDAEVELPRDARHPCIDCSAPCVGGWPGLQDRQGPSSAHHRNAASGPFRVPIAQATAEVRARCVVGQASRYDEDQIAYHDDRAVTVERLQKSPS